MTPQQLVAQRSRRQALQQSAGTARRAYRRPAIAGAALPDDLAREVYCVLGLPIDAVDMAESMRRIEAASASSTPYLISTPNLNFLINSRSDPEFRNSVLQSDLCPADGMPIVWIARLIGLPIRQRIAGSDIFDMLKARRHFVRPLKVFLFGGPEGIATAAARALNGASGGLTCVGAMYPGYGTVDRMSTDEIIDTINASGADFLAVALSAGKGQAWLHRNHGRLRTPVCAQLGAAINFQAGVVKRAPVGVRKLGLEWLWRIKEEPHLWQRYARDGAVLLRLLLTNVLPLALAAQWQRLVAARHVQDLLIKRSETPDGVILSLSGSATAQHVDKASAWFRDAISANRPISIDLANTCAIDARFLGLLLMVRKQVESRGMRLNVTGKSRYIATMFRLNGAEFMLSGD